jgi:hypothetical protein
MTIEPSLKINSEVGIPGSETETWNSLACPTNCIEIKAA